VLVLGGRVDGLVHHCLDVDRFGVDVHGLSVDRSGIDRRGGYRLGVGAAHVLAAGLGQREDLGVGATFASEQLLGHTPRVAGILRHDLLDRDLLERDRQRLVGVDLLDERGRVLTEPLTERVVVVVDLARTLRGEVNQCVFAVDLRQQVVDGCDDSAP
jgi:hypothetical protein